MIKDKKKRYCNKPNCMSDAEIMGILILFHLGAAVSSIITSSMSANIWSTYCYGAFAGYGDLCQVDGRFLGSLPIPPIFSSYILQIGLKNNESFIPGFIEFGNNNKETWRRIGEAMGYNPYIKYNGAEIKSILPNYIEAQNLFIKHNLKNSFEIPSKSILAKLIKHPFSKYKLEYPLVGSYSDFFITTADIMPKFCQYCGAFAATNLFVEIAIPTALVLAAPKIKTEVRAFRLPFNQAKIFWPVSEVS